MHAVVSVDGFIADREDDVGPLFEWYFNGDAEIVDGGPFKVSTESARYVRPMWQRIGTTVMGRHLSTSPTAGKAFRGPVNTSLSSHTGRGRRAGIPRGPTSSSPKSAAM